MAILEHLVDLHCLYVPAQENWDGRPANEHVVANALEVAEESQELVRQYRKGEVVQPALDKVDRDTDMAEVRSLAEQDTQLAKVVVERMIVVVVHKVVEGMLPKELDHSLVALAEER